MKIEVSIMSNGAYFRQLRQSKQVTLTELAVDTGLTPGFISRFERGQADISVTNFTALLTALNVSVAEFMLGQQAPAAGVARLRSELPFIAPFYQTVTASAPSDLAALLTAAEATYRARPTRKNHFVWLFYQGMTATVSEPPDVATMTHTGNVMARYLFQVEDWGAYECQLFQLFTPVLPPEQMMRLLKTGLKKSRQLAASPVFADMALALLVATLTSLMSMDHLDLAQDTYRLMQDWPPRNASQALAVEFFGGWLAMRRGQPAGAAQCEAVVREFQRLGLVAAARDFAHTLQTLRENPTQSRVLMNFQI